MILATIITVTLSFLVALGFTRAMIPLLQRRRVIDVPNHRSSHHVPTPTGGGIGMVLAIFVGFTAGYIFGLPMPDMALLLPLAIIAVTGAIDDLYKGLPVWIRLGAQCLAAVLVIWSHEELLVLPLPALLDTEMGALAVPLTFFWILGITNIYNFLDGIDGFAATQAVLAGLGLAVAFGFDHFMTTCLIVTAAALGFLIFNWHPAQVFMGDVGATTLGFLLAVLPLQVETALRHEAAMLLVLVLWFFLADGVFTIGRRLLKGERIWQPHRSHLYQRLVQSGLSHSQVVWRVMGMAALLILITLLLRKTHVSPTAFQWAFAIALVLFVIYWIVTIYRERKQVTDD